MKTTFTLLSAIFLFHYNLKAQNNAELNAPIQQGVVIPFDSSAVMPSSVSNERQAENDIVTAVPANDNCGNAIALTVNAACVNGTTKQATKQAAENVGCQGAGVTQSVWYKFVASATSMYVEVEWTASSGCYFGSAVWSGACLPSVNLSCIASTSGLLLDVHNLTGLTIGKTYYVQVTYTAGGACGNAGNAATGANFCIDVGTPVVCATCASPCGALCVFASAPTQAQVISTCTQYALKPRIVLGQSATECYTFKANNTSIGLNAILSSVGCPGSGGNVTTFNWTLQATGCGATIQSGTLANLTATGLTVGQNYILCYTWTSACQYQSGIYPYTGPSVPLPIELLNFQGALEKDKVRLTWSTASETNNNYFSIERAYAAVAGDLQFSSIGTVKGAGNSTELINYQYIDNAPFGAEGTANEVYYRLRQTDFDGVMSFSSVIAVKNTEKQLVHIHPNPAKGNFIISFDNELSQGEVEIYNPVGQMIYKQVFNDLSNNPDKQITLAATAGIYFVRVSTGSNIYVQKLMMQ